MENKVKDIIEIYKRDFPRINAEERYKWEAIAYYKKHWDIEAEDFCQMYTEAFRKAGNLLAAGMYYPYKMVVEYAKKDAEAVRKLFRMLYDESIPLEIRFSDFRTGFDAFVKPMKLNHYQDLHAISVYLAFEYPEKYFIYKYTMYKKFAERIGYTSKKPATKTETWKYDEYKCLCEKVLENIIRDTELIELSKGRLDESCYKDEALHLLTMDIIYFGFREQDKSIIADGYWPSLEEYDPNLSSEDWEHFLEEDKVAYPSTLVMLKAMLELGGEATCKHLGEVLGEHTSSCISRGTFLGKRVKERFDLPACMDGEKERYYPIPFVGKYSEENKDLYIWKLRPELREALQNMDLTNVNVSAITETDISKNTILYGPPGTGKTYNTVNYSVAIIENKPLDIVKAEDYETVLKRYNEYKEQGLIEFTTFHQSYGYEEFIEGIKPIMDNDDDERGDIQYQIKSGVFKNFCEEAGRPIITQHKREIGLNNAPTIWKVSLEGTGDNPTRTECMKNGHIRIGWDGYGENVTSDTNFEHGGKTVLNAFIYKMKVGDIVLSCYSATSIDAIGVVTGDYEWHNEYDKFKRLRKVNWIVKGIREDITKINNGTNMTLASVYKLNIALSDIMNIIMSRASVTTEVEEKKNYVFIIDEINRGNISKIFGELITLIETSKRVGKTEGMKVMLPYSQTRFGVPENVYIIGTMNTADRSIASIDTALRRRFRFKEMMPDENVLDDITIDGVSIKDMLVKINKRIAVLYDREHTIGHAYFVPLRENPTLEMLATIFADNIVPLLQEYFYEDFEKIRLVLGDNNKMNEEEQFIKCISNNYSELFGNAELDLDDTVSYEINEAAFMQIGSYKGI